MERLSDKNSCYKKNGPETFLHSYSLGIYFAIFILSRINELKGSNCLGGMSGVILVRGVLYYLMVYKHSFSTLCRAELLNQVTVLAGTCCSARTTPELTPHVHFTSRPLVP